MTVRKRLSVLLLLTLSFACVPAATRAAESEATLTAKFTISPEHPEVGSEVTFDGHESKDTDGTIKNYEWEFGDGTGTSGSEAVVASHTYTKKGEYKVTLTVEDVGGAKNPKAKLVVVNGKLQTVAIESEPPQPTYVGASYPVTAKASSGLEPTISASPTRVCEATGSTVKLVGAGECTVTATQSGGEEYAEAKAEQKFTVERKPQTVTI